MPTDAEKTTHESIMKLYDHAEQVLEIAEKYPDDAEKYFSCIEKIVNNVEDNCDLMIEKLEKYMRSNGVLSDGDKEEMIRAKNEVDKAFEEFFLKVGNEELKSS